MILFIDLINTCNKILSHKQTKKNILAKKKSSSHKMEGLRCKENFKKF